MSTNCAGRHVCEPPRFPDELGEEWTCDECTAHHYAFDVHAAYAGTRMEYALRGVAPGTLGWTTTQPAPIPAFLATEEQA